MVFIAGMIVGIVIGADAIWRRLRRAGRVACVRVEVREVEG